jgi:hypothetical protein
MQFTEDRGQPTYKAAKDADMILHKSTKHYPSSIDMAQTQEVDPAAILPDDVVSGDDLNKRHI